ncbi:cofactor-independent phosphoglycerate mutase [Methanoculleus sp. YWC-01]|jgi:2,3-bisphosphoglycerate-independent phosphoglycerate mutase|uniref:2,3-bisphosphoglycerate-independent phosphoglycerate mutase n=1 Tax=Methanoculleus nereidis TaxID=2735141 RepID=A0ABU3Z3S4_9EURY|nr:cofactor-independent phosphoglycerate mutase [Methanoculleus sp. YWC-01]MCK9298820.1 cofactor-independent phosphoglycerate mutase [Methanoculleus sp.]MDV4343438.1 cofactor-independent phosphoglycerate mutase [Methanoculleus sp. YWC-01]PKL55973.1 MAG: cofactor-independent phosphoglycerate mutase [Methanomicrobiales archaeon HGW-Methanomicrobiales-6]
MKYIIILGDGMADEPLAELGGRTPLEYAEIPNMDRIAREGRCGMLRTVPEGFEPGSDVANLSILGYDPRTSYTGRGPLEAASMGIDLGDAEMAYRCNLVAIHSGVMEDFNAGHITSAEGAELLRDLDAALSDVRVYPGISYRNLMVVSGARGAVTTPPHDIVDQPIAEFLPRGDDSKILLDCMERSREVFAGHPVNRHRVQEGKTPATEIWPWSGGKKPSLAPFREKYGLAGGVISAVDLLSGIARLAGMEVIHVPGATGFTDTDYEAKARYAVDALDRLDFVYMHVEAPDEAGHMGSVEEKVRAIERLDEAIGVILDRPDTTVAVLPDHPTPIRCKTHTADPVPFAVLGKGRDDVSAFSEREAAEGSFGLLQAPELLSLLFSP